MKPLITTVALLLLAPLAFAEDETEATQVPTNDEAVEAATEETAVAANAPANDGPKTMSGMSILGNEEAPKSLVIIPWKSSEIGADLGLDDSLGERAEAVDKDVFLRELEFYEIRSGE